MYVASSLWQCDNGKYCYNDYVAIANPLTGDLYYIYVCDDIIKEIHTYKCLKVRLS